MSYNNFELNSLERKRHLAKTWEKGLEDNVENDTRTVS